MVQLGRQYGTGPASLAEIAIDAPFPRDDAFRVSTAAAAYAATLSRHVRDAGAAAVASSR